MSCLKDELDTIFRNPKADFEKLEAILSARREDDSSLHSNDWFRFVQLCIERQEDILPFAAYGNNRLRRKNFIHAMRQYDKECDASHVINNASKRITSLMLEKYPDLIAEQAVDKDDDHVLEVAVSAGADWLIPDQSILPPPEDDRWNVIKKALEDNDTDRPILLKAVKLGQIEVVRKVVQLLKNFSLDQSHHGIALFQAIHERNLETARFLLEEYPAMASWEASGDCSVLHEIDNIENHTDGEEYRECSEMENDLVSKIFHQEALGKIRNLVRFKAPSQPPEVYVDFSDFDNNSHLDFNRFMEKLNKVRIGFYSTLVYVQLPELRHSSGKEAITILNWLLNNGVRTILHLQVPDSLEHPHLESDIEETLQKFTAIESLDWRILDMSLDTVRYIKGLKNLTLYSSGTRDVLKYWTGSEGLEKLKVQVVDTYIIESSPLSRDYATLYTFTEPGRNRGYEFTVRSIPSWADATSMPHMPSADDATALSLFLRSFRSFNDYVMSSQNSGHASLEPILLDVEEATGLSSFLSAFRVFRPRHSCHTRVAIIDTGVDLTWEEMSKTVEQGVSFVQYKSPTGGTRESPWWVPSEPHGTQMASIVAKLSPYCTLLIAKVGASRTEISIRNVTQAIEWAAAKGVDIISLSMTISRYDEALEREVKSASDKGILFFCSTEDVGASGHVPYPARWSEWTYAISGTDSGGKEVKATDRNAKYYFLGENIGTQGLTYGPSSIPDSGSSLATAVASGTASLVLSCHLWANKNKAKSRKRLVDTTFRSMMELSDRYVYPGKFFEYEPKERWTTTQWKEFISKKFKMV